MAWCSAKAQGQLYLYLYPSDRRLSGDQGLSSGRGANEKLTSVEHLIADTEPISCQHTHRSKGFWYKIRSSMSADVFVQASRRSNRCLQGRAFDFSTHKFPCTLPDWLISAINISILSCPSFCEETEEREAEASGL
jgi:hypothetical protein